MRRPTIWEYIIIATSMPNPWHVVPATTIDRPSLLGCVSAITDAMVPDSMMGKMGRIQVGIIVFNSKLWAAKTKLYWAMATTREKAT